MSTRGTYEIRIRTENEHFTQHFYVHWDSYPSGAARLLKQALDLKWENQVHGKHFIKRFSALDGPYMTHSEHDIGGAEYHYVITQCDDDVHSEYTTIKAYESGGGEYRLFTGPLAEFIAKYKDSDNPGEVN